MNLVKKFINTKYEVRRSDRWATHEESKTSYDNLVSPPPFDEKYRMTRGEWNFTVFDPNHIKEHILNKLEKFDPVFSKLSNPVRDRLRHNLGRLYYCHNILDLDQGGDGKIIPTFVEVMYYTIFDIKDKKIDMSIEDQLFVAKYNWVVEIMANLVVKHQFNKDVA